MFETGKMNAKQHSAADMMKAVRLIFRIVHITNILSSIIPSISLYKLYLNLEIYIKYNAVHVLLSNYISNILVLKKHKVF